MYTINMKDCRQNKKKKNSQSYSSDSFVMYSVVLFSPSVSVMLSIPFSSMNTFPSDRLPVSIMLDSIGFAIWNVMAPIVNVELIPEIVDLSVSPWIFKSMLNLLPASLSVTLSLSVFFFVISSVTVVVFKTSGYTDISPFVFSMFTAFHFPKIHCLRRQSSPLHCCRLRQCHSAF